MKVQVVLRKDGGHYNWNFFVIYGISLYIFYFILSRAETGRYSSGGRGSVAGLASVFRSQVTIRSCWNTGHIFTIF